MRTRKRGKLSIYICIPRGREGRARAYIYASRAERVKTFPVVAIALDTTGIQGGKKKNICAIYGQAQILREMKKFFDPKL